MKLKRAYIRDSRFVSEDRLTIKVAYVSIEVPTKSQVSLDPNLTKRSPRSSSVFHYQIHTKEKVIQTF
jgi:hypothetical protein